MVTRWLSWVGLASLQAHVLLVMWYPHLDFSFYSVLSLASIFHRYLLFDFICMSVSNCYHLITTVTCFFLWGLSHHVCFHSHYLLGTSKTCYFRPNFFCPSCMLSFCGWLYNMYLTWEMTWNAYAYAYTTSKTSLIASAKHRFVCYLTVCTLPLS